MKNLSIFLFLSMAINVFGQNTAIENVQIKVDNMNSQLRITYDLLEKNKFDSIVVNLYSNGKKINITNFKGDLGMNVTTSKEKLVIWDFKNEKLSGEMKLSASIIPIKKTVFNSKGGKIITSLVVSSAALSVFSLYKTYDINKQIKAYNSTSNPENPTQQLLINQNLKIVNSKIRNFNTLIAVTGTLSIGSLSYFQISRHKLRKNILNN